MWPFCTANSPWWFLLPLLLGLLTGWWAWSRSRGGLGDVSAGIGGALGSAASGIAGAAGSVASGVADVAGSAVSGVADVAGSAVSGVAGAAGTIASGVADVAGSAVSGVAGAAGTVASGVADVAGSAVSGVAGAAGTVASGVADVAGSAVSGVTGAAGALASGVKGAAATGVSALAATGAAAAAAIGIAPAVGDPDDLLKIKGIGPKLNGTLIGLGITRFDQIAAWTAADVDKVDDHMPEFQGRIAREEWIPQAKLLAAGKLTEWERLYGTVKKVAAAGAVALTAIGIPAAVGDPDDLLQIKGVGPKLNKLLISLGVTRFDQIAAWGAAEIDKVDDHLGTFKSRITRDNWVEQAGLLAKGAVAEFEAKFGKLDSENK